uniref:PA domain-containing protein n=1 Tax=Aplanochytrium stocchinoi TaxID=215587 RepID=A0A7S3LRA6_9STRA
MSFTNRLFCATVFLVFQYSLAQNNDPKEHHVSTKVNFRTPAGLKAENEDNTYIHTDALFGVPFQKNRMITGLVYYMTPPKDGVIDAGCADNYPVVFDDGEGEKKMTGVGNQVFLVDRGNCTFALKVRIAQANGAEAVIIANNECLNSDYEFLKNRLGESKAKELCCMFSSMPEQCKNNPRFPRYLPFMASNGNQGSDLSITIPAFMMTLTDSLKIKSYLCCDSVQSTLSADDIKYCQKLKDDDLMLVKQSECDKMDHKAVIADLKLDTPHPDGNVEYQLWMKSDTPPDFLESFEWFSQSIHTDTLFTPKYIVVNGQAYNCDKDSCGDFCLYDGKYCSIPEQPFLAGTDVLHENVRQHCIWEQEKDDFHKKGLPMWWEYQKQFRLKRCSFMDNGESFESCSKKITDSFGGLNQANFRACTEKDNEEKILKQLSLDQNDMAIFATSMIVNTRVIHFSLTSPLLAEVICDGFADGTAPKVCSCVSQASTENDLALCKKCLDTNDCDGVPSQPQVMSGYSATSVIGLLLGVSCVFGVGAVAYTRYQKRQMHDDVRNILAEYMPLEEVNGMSFSNSDATSMRTNADREDSNLI